MLFPPRERLFSETTMKFIKKAIAVDAWQVPHAAPLPPAWLREGMMSGSVLDVPESRGLMVKVTGTWLKAHPGDWIIKGVAGEFYPIKPDIFAKTYEAVE